MDIVYHKLQSLYSIRVDSVLGLYINKVYAQDIIFPYTGSSNTIPDKYKKVELTIDIPFNASIILRNESSDAPVWIEYIYLENVTQKVWTPSTPEDRKQARIDIVKGMQQYALKIDVSKYNLTNSEAEEIRKNITLYSEPTLYCVKGTMVGSTEKCFGANGVKIQTTEGKMKL